jgi:hypothetical protein
MLTPIAIDKMACFKVKTMPTLTYGLDSIWQHLRERHLTALEAVKATHLKKTLSIPIFTPSRLVNVLAKETFP